MTIIELHTFLTMCIANGTGGTTIIARDPGDPSVGINECIYEISNVGIYYEDTEDSFLELRLVS